MVQVKQVITKFRIKVALGLAILMAILFSSISLFGSTYGDVIVYLQTESFSTAIGKRCFCLRAYHIL